MCVMIDPAIMLWGDFLMSYDLGKAKVLIVEDMKPMQTLLRSILITYGFKDAELASGETDAFRIFCRVNPDLVVVDWVLEDGDGISLVRRIRKDPSSPNPFVPVVLMTGFSSRPRVEQARDMGVTEFLVKPFTSRDLYARIEHVIEKPRQFVELGDFFGPDRRRRRVDDYTGPRRRDLDQPGAVLPRPAEQPQGKVAVDVLRKLLDEAKKAQK